MLHSHTPWWIAACIMVIQWISVDLNFLPHTVHVYQARISLVPRPHPPQGKGSGDIGAISWLCWLSSHVTWRLQHPIVESTISRFKQRSFSASVFEDHRLKRTDFTIVQDSKSIGAGPGVALFENTKTLNRQTAFLCSRVAISNKMVSHIAAVQQVLCSLSVCVTQWRWNAQWGPGETCKLSFGSYSIICRPFNFAKTDAENFLTFGEFLFVFPI